MKIAAKLTFLKVLVAYCAAAMLAGLVVSPTFENYGVLRANLLVYLVFPPLAFATWMSDGASMDSIMFATVFLASFIILLILMYFSKKAPEPHEGVQRRDSE